MMHVNLLSNHLVAFLLLLILSPLSAFAQDDPCSEDGYELRISASNALCYGSNTGSAVVTSDQCSCFHSSCTFEWSDGQSYHLAENLAAGTYSVTVSAPNGCVQVATVTVDEPESFIEKINTVDADCGSNQGSAEVTPLPNAGTLSYEWSNGSTEKINTDLAPGSYTLTVTNFIGCQYIDTIQIATSTNSSAMKVDIETRAACPELGGIGQVAIQVEGGEGPYEYIWSDGLQSSEASSRELAIGQYAVTVVDANGCEYVASNVSIPTANEFIELVADQTSICPGQPVRLSFRGDKDCTYNWTAHPSLSDLAASENIVAPLATTTYQVEVTNDLGCKTQKQITIFVNPDAPAPRLNAWDETICRGGSTQLVATVSGGTTNAFTWSPTTGLSDSTINAPIASPTETTTYTVTTKGGGCTTSSSITIVVDACSGIEEYLVQPLQVGPNPSNGSFLVNFDLLQVADIQLNIYNTLGQQILSSSYPTFSGSFEQWMELPNVEKGLYYLELVINGERSTQKLVVY